MKTFQPTQSTVNRQWHLVDAKNQVLGRLASQVAHTIQGKGKTVYSPHVDCGDFVVIINAGHVKIKGNNKPVQKIDFRHSGFPGGYTMTPYGEFLKKHPERAVYLAISGMLPKNKIRPRQLKRLRVFRETTHPHGVHFSPPKQKENSSREK